MKKNRAQLLLLLPLLLAVQLRALAAEEDVSQQDPQRWYQGDDTPALHYRNLLREAHAAAAQARLECRTLKGGEARTCRQEANSNMADDLARAKRIYKKNRAGAEQ